jgi:MoaA/NifB/PqqE/SkfB family radical SAM enzyme
MERDPLEVILERVDYIKAYGITEIDLSGGESSIEPNWFKILEYCQDKFGTNGSGQDACG